MSIQPNAEVEELASECAPVGGGGGSVHVGREPDFVLLDDIGPAFNTATTLTVADYAFRGDPVARRAYREAEMRGDRETMLSLLRG